jgi:hypothetical protein
MCFFHGSKDHGDSWGRDCAEIDAGEFVELAEGGNRVALIALPKRRDEILPTDPA